MLYKVEAIHVCYKDGAIKTCYIRSKPSKNAIKTKPSKHAIRSKLSKCVIKTKPSKHAIYGRSHPSMLYNKVEVIQICYARSKPSKLYMALICEGVLFTPLINLVEVDCLRRCPKHLLLRSVKCIVNHNT